MSYKDNDFKVYIKNKEEMYKPIVTEEITIEWQRGMNAGSLKFKVVKDEIINYQEGNPVVLMNGDDIVFVGYVWKKTRDSKQIIETTCFDQLRYLKNKDAIQYENKTYGELLKMICDDGLLKIGTIEDTKYKIPARTERDKEYFQMLQVASEMTTSMTGKEFVLYDEKGKICLKEWKNISTTDNIITYDITQDFSYETTIDGSYNRIKINYVDDETQKVEPYIMEDKETMKLWGRLQYYAETSTKQQLKERAKTLLEILNKKHRSLTIQNTAGDFRVRAGSLVPVYFPFLGDIHVNSLMLVNKVTHKIKGSHHFMDLEVYNKDIMPQMSGEGLFEGAKKRQKQESVESPEGATSGGGASGGYTTGSGKLGAKFIYPLPRKARVSGRFGTNRGDHIHAGVDLGVPVGTPVRAVQGGVVTRAFNKWPRGKAVYIKHPGGIVTVSQHLSSIKVKVGDKIDQGQIIGLSGNTGYSKGPHLHFEVLVGGRPRNPMKYI